MLGTCTTLELLTDGLRHIEEPSLSMSSKYMGIEGSLHKKHGMLKDIAVIANQANLLSLNAAIKAACADEYDAVKQDAALEIRKLSKDVAMMSGELIHSTHEANNINVLEHLYQSLIGKIQQLAALTELMIRMGESSDEGSKKHLAALKELPFSIDAINQLIKEFQEEYSLAGTEL